MTKPASGSRKPSLRPRSGRAWSWGGSPQGIFAPDAADQPTPAPTNRPAAGSLSQADAERAEEARRALDAVQRDSHLLGGSAMARVAEHFSGGDAPEGDRIEVWGRRIGRILSLAFALYLVSWLYAWFTR